MGWPLVKLSEICTDIFAGGDVPKDRLSKFRTEKYSIPIYSNGENNKGLYGFTDTARVFKPCITVSARGTIGYSEVRYEPFLPVVRLIVLIPNLELIELDFLKYVLKGLNFVNSGTSIPQLTVPMIKDYECELPSISEQKRIVAILDQAYADIDQARATAETNLKNARELFDSYLQQVFSLRGDLGDLVPLATITESISDGDHSAPPKSETGIPFITISNINKFTNEIDFSDTFKVPKDYYLGLKAFRKPTVGDVLYTVTGSYGIPVLIQKAKDFCFQRHIGLVRPRQDVDSKWLYYLLMSPQVFKQADRGATGTAQKTVSLNLLRNISVPKTPLNIQRDMVVGLDAIYAYSKELEKLYRLKLTKLDELKKSILHKAFTGELTKSKGIAA